MFAPVGRGTPGHPDRDRQRHHHPQDRSDARPQRLDGRQGDQTRHVVPVQRERVLPAVPAETAEDGPVDGRILHRRPRGGARPAAGAPNRASATACHANACGRGWPNGWVAAGRCCSSAAGCASCSPTTPPCACARRPSTVGSTPTAVAVNAGCISSSRCFVLGVVTFCWTSLSVWSLVSVPDGFRRRARAGCVCP